LEFRDRTVNQEREILPCTAPNGSEAQTNVSVYVSNYKLLFISIRMKDVESV
jgi:hypothetical protein